MELVCLIIVIIAKVVGDLKGSLLALWRPPQGYAVALLPLGSLVSLLSDCSNVCAPLGPVVPLLVKPPHFERWIEEHSKAVGWNLVAEIIVLVELLPAKVNASLAIRRSQVT